MNAGAGWWLWLRTRNAPVAAAATAIMAGAYAWTAHRFSGLDGLNTPEGRAPLAFWSAVAVGIVWSGGFRPATPEFESTGARSPGRLNVLYLLVATGIACVGALAALPDHGTTYGWAAAARTIAGFLGVTAMSARVLPRNLLWLPPTLCGLIWGAASAPFSPTIAEAVLLWPKQPGGFVTASGSPDMSWAVAATLLAGGFIACWRDV